MSCANGGTGVIFEYVFRTGIKLEIHTNGSQNRNNQRNHRIQVALLFRVSRGLFIPNRMHLARYSRVSWHVGLIISISIIQELTWGIFLQSIVEYLAMSFKLYVQNISMSSTSTVSIPTKLPIQKCIYRHPIHIPLSAELVCM